MDARLLNFIAYDKIHVYNILIPVVKIVAPVSHLLIPTAFIIVQLPYLQAASQSR